MSISFFNTRTGSKEEFKPLQKDWVGLYTCGPTVYDFAHIGNFRTFVFEDLLRRFLEFSGYKVRHVMNLTDVDDKTIAEANQKKMPLAQFTQIYVDAFQEDMTTLNLLVPNHPAEQPRATSEIPAMIDLIAKLLKAGAAYESDGSIYYRVAAFPDYGKLSRKDLKQNQKGVRVDVDEYAREEATDFALWKKTKEGEPSWDSPWGKGRPGWHIECSAMSMKYLGENFDIHAGGEDLIFPHHENEIAQSEAATGKRPFVACWLHSKHLLVDGEKMSKSKGNFYTLRDLIAKSYDPMAIRVSLLSVHYRSPLNFTLRNLDDAKEAVRKLDDCYFQYLSLAQFGKNKLSHVKSTPLPEHRFTDKITECADEITCALSDDLNISKALSHVFHGITEINFWMNSCVTEFVKENNLKVAAHFFKTIDQIFGFDISQVNSISGDVIKLLGELYVARTAKDFQSAQKIRSQIENLDWAVKDGRAGEPSSVKKVKRVWDQPKK